MKTRINAPDSARQLHDDLYQFTRMYEPREARPDWSMTLGALFLFVVGAGPWSLGARLTRQRLFSR